MTKIEAMRVLHVIDSGGLYGAEMVLLNLMDEQARMGIDPILASIGEKEVGEKPLETEARRRNLRVQTFRMRPGPNFLGAAHVLHFAWRKQIALIHSHGYKGNILFGFLPRRIRRMPVVSTLHGWTWTGELSRIMVYEWLDSLSLDFLDRVVVVSEAMKGHARLRDRSRLPLEVVPNGIPLGQRVEKGDDHNDLKREIVDFCGGGYTIGAIGRLSPEKGFGFLIEALAALIAEGMDIRLALLGEGGLRDSLHALVRHYELQHHVLMPGYVENAKRYLPLFQIFAMPSLTEGLPMVLLEAMDAGIPIVASAVGGIPNVLDDGQAGLLLAPGSAAAIKQGLTETIINPAGTLRRVQTATRRVRERFSSQTMAERYFEIYQEVLRSPTASTRVKRTL